ncbi:MAG: hypothetical protein ABSC61_09400 [Anaerolineales bacterium]
MRRRHPLIAERIATGEGSACFTTVGVPPLPVRVMERALNDDWQSEVEYEIAIPFGFRVGPFFRCIFLRGRDISDLSKD